MLRKTREMFEKIKPRVKDIAVFFLGAFGGEQMKKLLAGELEGGIGVVAERIRSVIKDNPRLNVFLTLLALRSEDREKFEAFKKQHGESLKVGEENDLVIAIGHTLPQKPDGSLDIDGAKTILSQWLELNQEETEQMLELLRHDPFMQKFRHYCREGKDLVEAVLLAIAYLTGRAVTTGHNFYRRVDGEATQLARIVNQRVENPGWLGGLANRIFR